MNFQDKCEKINRKDLLLLVEAAKNKNQPKIVFYLTKLISQNLKWMQRKQFGPINDHRDDFQPYNHVSVVLCPARYKSCPSRYADFSFFFFMFNSIIMKVSLDSMIPWTLDYNIRFLWIFYMVKFAELSNFLKEVKTQFQKLSVPLRLYFLHNSLKNVKKRNTSGKNTLSSIYWCNLL